MPNYMFAYHGGKAPTNQADIDRSMAAWGKWMDDHKSSLVDPGNPVGMSRTVSKTGVAQDGGSNPLSGYTIVSAPDIEAACAIAGTNPMIEDGGTVEVAEIHVIEM